MPQQTNLNVSPYFDDFDPKKDYHRVLFKPGYPVQARELTTLQSILQNQIEKFGQHFFKEGAKVIPGNTGYNQLYYAVELNNNYQGIPVSAYVDQLVGKKITGQRSGVTAFVDNVLLPQDSERGNLTLYVNYLSSSTSNNSSQVFSDGEELVCDTTITSGLLGNSTIAAGSPLALTISSNATSVGSSFNIQDGVYFIRGQFVNVNKETLILDQYSNTPSYRIGLYVNEEIVNADFDESLNDNSQGFNNYAAPGADRLKISVNLFKKPLNDFNDDNFVELGTIENGVLRSLTKKGFSVGPNGGVFYDDLENVLARRTFDESGDYYVKPFDVTVMESLNAGVGNNGVFNEGQTTYGGSVASNNLALYKISPGKAFVRGFELETIAPTFIDVEKPRTTRTEENKAFLYNTGPTFKLNRVYGAPTVGLGNTYILSLRDSRVGVSSVTAPGNEIGVARVYDFRLESGSYDSTNDKFNRWDIALYDIQTTTEITLNQPVSISVPAFIKGKNSGATAFLYANANNTATIKIYENRGNFILNESLIVNGIDNGRTAIAITSYNVSDVKSVYGIVGSGSTFTADVIQSTQFNVGIASITPVSGGVSTVRSQNLSFPGNIKVNNLIQYTDFTKSTDPIVAKVVSVGSSHISITGVTPVPGIANGSLPTSSPLEVTDFKVLSTKLENSSDNTLYTRLPKNNISNVDLTNSSVTIRKVFKVNISSNQLSSPVPSGDNETFLAFDEERYALIRSDGKTETLTADKFAFTASGTQLQIYNLGANDTGATLIASLRKSKPKEKVKIKNRVNSILVDKSKLEGSGIGATTLDDGLIYGNYPYGTRVQDELISLNVPDVIRVYSIFESSGTDDPSSPKMVLSSLTSASTTTAELIIGEKLVGQTSGAIAICAEKLTDSQISFLYLGDSNFTEGETVIFQESAAQGTITTIESNSFNITTNYTFQNEQRDTIYAYSSIRRKSNTSSPTKKLKIYFSNSYFESSDDGDFVTVNSYKNLDYGKDLKLINGIPQSDIIDIRPRVSEFIGSEGSRSPLEFFGRTFNQSGNSSRNIIASDETLSVTYSYYLGRVDRIYLSKDGTFQLVKGTPSETPERPVPIDDALEIASITLPPYLYDVKQAALKFLDYKRYQMKDIKKLEDRISNLEYYTTLSLLETDTANLFIDDGEGLNRFKSGFFVDNFKSFTTQDFGLPINNSIDRERSELRPRHYTNSIDLIFGPVVNADPTVDLNFSTIEGNNIRKQSDIITLDYAEVEWLKQSFATRTESVTPFMISFWQGTLELTPESDTWVDTVRLEPKIIDTEGNYAETMALAERTLGVDPQTGLSPITWNSWETIWTGTEVTQTTRQRTGATISAPPQTQWIQGNGTRLPIWGVGTAELVEDTYNTTVYTDNQTRTGSRTIVTETFEQTSVGDRTVSREVVPFMRSRNVQFVARKVKPLTRLYAFFDGVAVTKYCVPKLMEITMRTGTFQVGEKVIGRMPVIGLDNRVSERPRIVFRVAQLNHKEGPYDSPTKVWRDNPYSNQPLPSEYSSTSDVLNVDTYSLSNHVQGEYGGWIAPGMELVGESSGATATINDLRLISDISSMLIGSYFIPNPNNVSFPRFEAGTKIFTITNDENNDQNLATTIAEDDFTSSGTIETLQENIISVRNAVIENKQEFAERAVQRTGNSELVSSKVIGTTSVGVIVGWYDPLAQSFLVDDQTGVFVTKCDIFFSTKDDMDIPVTFQLRTMENGFPTQKVLPFSEIILDPEDINVSSDGSVATTFQFKAPIYLEGGKEYAIALASFSTKYNVYISRIGEVDILTDTFISNQPYLGSLFKSQNASTWEPSQWEDLKFTLYRADFLESGSVEFYNPELNEGNGQIPNLMPDPLDIISKRIQVGLSTTLSDSGYVQGNTFFQLGTTATGNLVGSAGTATGQLSITNPGIGYTPVDGYASFNGVNLVTITGNGRGATANITIQNGVAIAATVINGGSGYQKGDVLGITTIGNISAGRNMRLSVVAIGATSELVFDNVQGDFVVGAANTIMYVNSAGITTELNYSAGGGVKLSSINTVSDGLHIKVNHLNHGMYSDENLVRIFGVQSDINPTKLSASYDIGSTGAISVDNATQFSTFENVGVGTTNVGYLLIGDEIIEYTNVSGNTIGGNIVRGINPKSYPVGTPVYKYENSGVSLRRINKTHDFGDVTVSDPISFDSYYIKLDMSSDGTDRSTENGYPKLYLNQTKPSGGYTVRASQNMPYEIISPMVQNVTVKGTNISAEIRTTTGKSLSGNEIPFINNGFQEITLNQTNYLDTTRIVCSKVNEDNKLTNVPGNKSMNMRVYLNTSDSRISPVIDAQRVNTILTSNRVNSVITDYATDDRVVSVFNDPTACTYITKEVILENPATSLRLLLAAHVNSNSDIRAFYSISNQPTQYDPIFIPFPGYLNLDSRGRIIAQENNDGRPDTLIQKSNVFAHNPNPISDYKDYTFNVDNLPSFKYYRIKLVLTSTDQVYVPRIKDLRTIALA